MCALLLLNILSIIYPIFLYCLITLCVTYREWVNRICDLIEKNGMDCWWKFSIEELVGEEILEKFNLDKDNLKKGDVRKEKYYF